MNNYSEILQEYANGDIFYLDYILDKEGVLEISLRGSKMNSLKIIFDSYISYRKIDEGDAMLVLEEISKYSRLGLSFYLAKRSDFIDWVVMQSRGVRKSNCILHYLIATIDDIIEVASLEPPLIRVS